MKVKIKERKDNPFLDRKELEGSIDHKEEATPSADALQEFLAKELDINREKIEVDRIYTLAGSHKSTFKAKEYSEKEVEEVSEEETAEEEKTEEGTETKESIDYEETVGGTISEGKERINGLEEELTSEDFNKLLEAEKENKDRKGMKKFLESKSEE